MCTMVECKPLKHCWLEVHEQNFRRDQLGLKRTLNMRQDQKVVNIPQDVTRRELIKQISNSPFILQDTISS